MGSTGAAVTPPSWHGVTTPPPTPDGDAPGAGGAHDGHVALPVGPVDAHAVPGKPRERAGGGMAVGVVRPHRDECDAGAAGGEEVGVGVGATVVRHLEDVGAQVDAVPDQPGLGLGTEIAGQQGGDAPHGQPGHH